MTVSPMEWTAREESIRAHDGTSLRARYWPHPEPRGVLVISHGLGEHAGCYQHVAESIGPAAAVDVLAFDYRGHGRSPGRRGLVRRYEDLVDDLRGALDWAGATRPGRPRVVLGHSNGGQVAIRTALKGRDDLAGLILSNPTLGLRMRVPRHKLWLGHFLNLCAPRVTLSSADASGEMMTRDPAMLAGRLKDALRHSRISPRLYFGMVAGGPLVLAGAGSIRVPTLVVLGESDPVTDTALARAFFSRLGSPDKTLLVDPEALHEPLNDLGRDRILAEIAGWISARLG